VHKDEVAPFPVEVLRDTTPTLVPTFGRKEHIPMTRAFCVRRRLDLNAEYGSLDLGDYVDIWAMPHRHVDMRPFAGKPLHGGELPHVSLLARL
jgi:hypothetical protein